MSSYTQRMSIVLERFLHSLKVICCLTSVSFNSKMSSVSSSSLVYSYIAYDVYMLTVLGGLEWPVIRISVYATNGAVEYLYI